MTIAKNKMASTEALSEKQKSLIWALRLNDGIWPVDCGWFWYSPAEVDRMLEELENRGLVAKSTNPGGRHQYTLTEKGKKA